MVTLSVSGTAQHFHPAERGTAKIDVRLESRDRAKAVGAVTSLHARLSAEAKAHTDAGAATWWATDQVRVSSVRRYIKDSDVTEIFHVASASVSVKFRDFAALSGWVGEIALVDGVVVQGIEWALTVGRRQAAEREARTAAVRDAQERAIAYAAALGFGSVEVRALYEPGLRPDSSANGGGGGMMSRAMAYKTSGGDELALKPEDIEVAAEITADFEAR